MSTTEQIADSDYREYKLNDVSTDKMHDFGKRINDFATKVANMCDTDDLKTPAEYIP